MDFIIADVFAAGRGLRGWWCLRALHFALSPNLLRFEAVNLTNTVVNRQNDKAACKYEVQQT
jgi:hypothetical protein